MANTNLFIVAALFAATAASGMTLVKRELSHHEDHGYHGLNSIHDFGHLHAFKFPQPPAYSTVSFVRSTHSKPVSYSGFTNHGRGHHDPGYAIEFRSDGFHGHHQGHHDYHHYHHHY